MSKKSKVVSKTEDDDTKASDLESKDLFRILDLYFYRKRYIFRHLYNSYDKFLEEDIKLFLVHPEGHVFYEKIIDNIIYKNKFKFENVRYLPPTFENKVDPIFPLEARQKSLTYSVSLIVDISQWLEKINVEKDGETEERLIGSVEKNVTLVNIPLMLYSKYCNLHLYHQESKECDYDPGGYFIVKGSEKSSNTARYSY